MSTTGDPINQPTCVCLLCKTETPFCMDIFGIGGEIGGAGNSSNLGEIIHQHYGIPVLRDDVGHESSRICYKCWTITENFLNLYDFVRNTESALMSMLDRPISHEQSHQFEAAIDVVDIKSEIPAFDEAPSASSDGGVATSANAAIINRPSMECAEAVGLPEMTISNADDVDQADANDKEPQPPSQKRRKIIDSNSHEHQLDATMSESEDQQQEPRPKHNPPFDGGLSEIMRTLKEIAIDVAYTRSVVTSLSERMAALERHMSPAKSRHTGSVSRPKLPILTVEDLDVVEAALEDAEAVKLLEAQLKNVGGKTDAQAIRRVSAYCFGPTIAAAFTWHGKGEKRALKRTQIAGAIERAMASRGITLCETALEVGNWLRHTADRNRKKNTDTNHLNGTDRPQT